MKGVDIEMTKLNYDKNGQLTRINVPIGTFCSDCPYYTQSGMRCSKTGGQIPFHLSEYCINYNGKKYTDCPNY